jgi:hypothetical protein
MVQEKYVLSPGWQNGFVSSSNHWFFLRGSVVILGGKNAANHTRGILRDSFTKKLAR